MERESKKKYRGQSKWSFGSLFRRRKTTVHSDASSSTEGELSMPRRRGKRKPRLKVVGRFDHVVTNRSLATIQTIWKTPVIQNEVCALDGVNRCSSDCLTPRSSRESLPPHHRKQDSSSGSVDGSTRRIRREKIKARVEARRSKNRADSSSDEDGFPRSPSLSRFRSDDTMSPVLRENTTSRKTRSARTERYMKRHSREDELNTKKDSETETTFERNQFEADIFHSRLPPGLHGSLGRNGYCCANISQTENKESDCHYYHRSKSATPSPSPGQSPLIRPKHFIQPYKGSFLGNNISTSTFPPSVNTSDHSARDAHIVNHINAINVKGNGDQSLTTVPRNFGNQPVFTQCSPLGFSEFRPTAVSIDCSNVSTKSQNRSGNVNMHNHTFSNSSHSIAHCGEPTTVTGKDDVVIARLPIDISTPPMNLSESNYLHAVPSSFGHTLVPPTPPPRDPHRRLNSAVQHEYLRPLSYAFESSAESQYCPTFTAGNQMSNTSKFNQSNFQQTSSIWSGNRFMNDNKAKLTLPQQNRYKMTSLLASHTNKQRPASVTGDCMKTCSTQPLIPARNTRDLQSANRQSQDLVLSQYFVEDKRNMRPRRRYNNNMCDQLYMSDSQVDVNMPAQERLSNMMNVAEFWHLREKKRAKNVSGKPPIQLNAIGDTSRSISPALSKDKYFSDSNKNEQPVKHTLPLLSFHKRNSTSVNVQQEGSDLNSKKIKSLNKSLNTENNQLNSKFIEERNFTSLKNNELKEPSVISSEILTFAKNIPPPPPIRRCSRQNSTSSIEVSDTNCEEENGVKPINLEDALLELEAIYNSLRLGDDDFLNKVENDDKLSKGIPLTKNTCEAESDSGFDYSLASSVGSSNENFKHYKEQKAKSKNCSSPPDKVTDDMAYRRLHPKYSSAAHDVRHLISRTGSFLLLHPVLANEETVNRSKIKHCDEPDITFDDVVFRSVRHTNNTLKINDPQPPFGIPLHPVLSSSNNDYLHATPSNAHRHAFKPNKIPDIIQDDLAFRNLRKDYSRDLPSGNLGSNESCGSNKALEDHSNVLLRRKRATRSLSANLMNIVHWDSVFSVSMKSDQEMDKAHSLTDLPDALKVGQKIISTKGIQVANSGDSSLNNHQNKDDNNNAAADYDIENGRLQIDNSRLTSAEERAKIFKYSQRCASTSTETLTDSRANLAQDNSSNSALVQPLSVNPLLSSEPCVGRFSDQMSCTPINEVQLEELLRTLAQETKSKSESLSKELVQLDGEVSQSISETQTQSTQTYKLGTNPKCIIKKTALPESEKLIQEFPDSLKVINNKSNITKNTTKKTKNNSLPDSSEESNELKNDSLHTSTSVYTVEEFLNIERPKHVCKLELVNCQEITTSKSCLKPNENASLLLLNTSDTKSLANEMYSGNVNNGSITNEINECDLNTKEEENEETHKSVLLPNVGTNTESVSVTKSIPGSGNSDIFKRLTEIGQEAGSSDVKIEDRNSATKSSHIEAKTEGWELCDSCIRRIKMSGQQSGVRQTRTSRLRAAALASASLSDGQSGGKDSLSAISRSPTKSPTAVTIRRNTAPIPRATSCPVESEENVTLKSSAAAISAPQREKDKSYKRKSNLNRSLLPEEVMTPQNISTDVGTRRRRDLSSATKLKSTQPATPSPDLKQRASPLRRSPTPCDVKPMDISKKMDMLTAHASEMIAHLDKLGCSSSAKLLSPHFETIEKHRPESLKKIVRNKNVNLLEGSTDLLKKRRQLVPETPEKTDKTDCKPDSPLKQVYSILKKCNLETFGENHPPNSQPVSILKRKTSQEEAGPSSSSSFHVSPVSLSPSVSEHSKRNSLSPGILKKRASLDESEVARRRSCSPDIDSKSILKNQRRSSFEEVIRRVRSPDIQPHSILKKNPQRDEELLERSTGTSEPQGILKRKLVTSGLTVNIPKTTTSNTSHTFRLHEEDAHHVRPILKKKTSSEENADSSPTETPKPILKKKYCGGGHETEDKPTKPILKSCKKCSEGDDVAYSVLPMKHESSLHKLSSNSNNLDLDANTVRTLTESVGIDVSGTGLIESNRRIYLHNNDFHAIAVDCALVGSSTESAGLSERAAGERQDASRDALLESMLSRPVSLTARAFSEIHSDLQSTWSGRETRFLSDEDKEKVDGSFNHRFLKGRDVSGDNNNNSKISNSEYTSLGVTDVNIDGNNKQEEKNKLEYCVLQDLQSDCNKDKCNSLITHSVVTNTSSVQPHSETHIMSEDNNKESVKSTIGKKISYKEGNKKEHGSAKSYGRRESSSTNSRYSTQPITQEEVDEAQRNIKPKKETEESIAEDIVSTRRQMLEKSLSCSKHGELGVLQAGIKKGILKHTGLFEGKDSETLLTKKSINSVDSSVNKDANKSAKPPLANQGKEDLLSASHSSDTDKTTSKERVLMANSDEETTKGTLNMHSKEVSRSSKVKKLSPYLNKTPIKSKSTEASQNFLKELKLRLVSVEKKKPDSFNGSSDDERLMLDEALKQHSQNISKSQSQSHVAEIDEDVVSDETEGRLRAGIQRSFTQPMPNTGDSISGGSIAERLAALQQHGTSDWKKRILRVNPEDVLSKHKCNSADAKDAPPSSILADRLGKLDAASEEWRKRVGPTDAAQFSVAGRMSVLQSDTKEVLLSSPNLCQQLLQIGYDPKEKRCQPPTKFHSKKGIPQDSSTPNTPLKEEKSPLAFTRSVSAPDVDETSDSLQSSPSSKGHCQSIVSRVSVPQYDDKETFQQFYPAFTVQELSSELAVSETDFDEITKSISLLSVKKSEVKVQRRNISSRNPLKVLASRTDLREEYIEVKSGIAERELKKLKLQQLSQQSSLSVEALAALASTEDFTAVSLKKGVELFSPYLPYKRKMLLLIKGRRHVQTRLVEPVAASVNCGDSFVLVTPTEVFLWIGEFSNVIERSRGAEIAQGIVQNKGLGYQGNGQLITISQENLTCSKKHIEHFWQHLDGDLQYQPAPAGHPDEDEIYESSIIATNMIYELQKEELIPVEACWGSLPCIKLLEPSKVFIFDFGSELYVWSGKNASKENKRQALLLAHELWDEGYDYTVSGINPFSIAKMLGARSMQQKTVLISPDRPSWALMGKITQHTETVLFQEKFIDWPNFSRVIKSREIEEDQDQAEVVLNLKPVDPSSMLDKRHADPDLQVENIHLGRGVEYFDNEIHRCNKITTKEVIMWHVKEFDFTEMDCKLLGEFHSGDSYVIKWTYSITVTGCELNTGKPSKHEMPGRKRSCYFLWQGKFASINEQGAAALLTVQLDSGDGPQVRVEQGYEPPAFLNLFKGSMIVYQGKRDDSVCKKARWKLFICRGETENEAVLCEVPCRMRQLRSRAGMVLVDVKRKCMFIWYGSKVSRHAREIVKSAAMKLKKQRLSVLYTEEFKDFQVCEEEEGHESERFFEGLNGRNRNLYESLTNKAEQMDHTPRLYRLSSISGSFIANEILGPYRKQDLVCGYPFLQDDLYSANQPALFLLDNFYDLWIWQGWWPETDSGSVIPSHRWQAERRAAMQTALDYWIKLHPEHKGTVHAYLVWAGLESTTFTNLFPTWEDRDDVAELNIQEGHKPGEALLVDQELARLTKSTYPLHLLLQRPLPEGVDPSHLEVYLEDNEFYRLLHMNKEEFAGLPNWKKTQYKKDAGLF